MRLRLQIAATVLGVSAAAAQAGDVEWARRRGESSSRQELAFAAGLGAGSGAVAGGIAEARSLRRPRPTQRAAAVSMQLNAAGDNESMDYKRRSVTRSLFSDNSKEISGWMTTLRNFDGPEMPFDEMVEVWSDADKMMNIGNTREGGRPKAITKRYKHFDLRRNPTLLTKTEEIELGRKVQELLRWERVRSFLEVRLGRPATMEEWATELAAMDGVEGVEREIRVMKAARDRMIACNLRLVLHIARKKFYTGASNTLKVSLEDMIQDGTAGLVKAVERFDPEKGFRFSTYATWWVHQGIHCGFADCGRVIRLPMNLHTQVCKVMRLQTAMVDQLGRAPTVEELSVESGLEERTVEKCLRVSKVEPVSLDGSPKPRSGHLHFETRMERIGDSVMSVQEPEPVDGADVKLLKTDVETILGDLSDREAYVLRMRFGLGGSSPSTLATVAQELRLTRERVRQIQLAAIKKLRGRSPTHEVLYSDRAVAGEKDPAAITVEWDGDEEEGEEGEEGGGGVYGGLPSPVLMDLVKQALEPREDEMLDEDGRVVSDARRRLMREAAQAERAAAVAVAVAAAAAAAAAVDGKDRASAAGKKKRGFVMKRPYSKRSRVPAKGSGTGAGRDAPGAKTVPPAAQRTVAWQPSLQAA